MQKWVKTLNDKENAVNILEMERLNFEYVRIMDNICYLLDTRRNASSLFSSAIFKEYEERQYLIKAEYEIRKAELEKKTLPVYLANVNWNLNYQTREFIITFDCEPDESVEEKLENDGWKKEKCSSCKCGYEKNKIIEKARR